MIRKSVIICAIAVAIAGCSQPGNNMQRLNLTGSSTIAPLMSEIAKRFEALHPGVQVDVQAGGSSRGVADARNGLADIGMVSRSLHADEADLQSFTIARDGIAVILHRDNPVTAMTRQQIIDVYTGITANWGDIGGNQSEIVVVNKAEGRSTLELFLHHFGMTSAQVKASVVIGDNEQGIKTVAGNVDAVGYVSLGNAEYDVMAGVAIKLIPLDGIPATSENMARGRYPLGRPLKLVFRQNPEGLSKKLLDFALSAQVKDLILKQYYVPISG